MALLKPIALKVAVRASRAAVWKALTDPKQLTKWFARHARVIPRKNGIYELGWGGVSLPHTITEWKPPKALSLALVDGTNLRITLGAKGGETVVELAASGYRDDVHGLDEWADDRRVFAFYLLNLKALLEKRVDLREKNRKRTAAGGWANPWS
jgi:uncharacterized protein YndB with AHSA1/START domain